MTDNSVIPAKPTGSSTATAFADFSHEKLIHVGIKLKQSRHHKVRVLAAAKNVTIAKFIEDVIDELTSEESISKLNISELMSRK